MARQNRSTKTVASSNGNKFRTYRANKRHQGLKLVRLWLPDSRSANVRRRIRRQCLAVRGTPADREALEFIEAVNEEEHWPQ